MSTILKMVNRFGRVIIREDIKTVLLQAHRRKHPNSVLWKIYRTCRGFRETASGRSATPAEKFPVDSHILSEELRFLNHASRKFGSRPGAQVPSKDVCAVYLRHPVQSAMLPDPRVYGRSARGPRPHGQRGAI